MRSRHFITAATALLALAIGAFAAGVAGGFDDVVRLDVLGGSGRAVSTALTSTAGALLLLRWRLVGDAQAGWVGAALLTFAVVALGLGEALGRLLLAPEAAAVLAWFRPAGVAATLLLLTLGLLSPEVDARLRGLRLAAVSVLLVAALVALLPLAPAVAGLLAAASDVPGAALPDQPILVALAWTVLASVYALRGVRQRRTLFAWVGLALLALALSELLRVASATEADPSGWLLGSTLLQIAAGAIALAGALSELRRAWLAQSRRLLDTEVSRQAEAARVRAQQAESAERAHEARNALQAIEGATLALERHREHLAAADREQLATAVTGEIARLQRLVVAERAADGLTSVDLVALAEAQAALARSRGAACLVESHGEVAARARSAEVAEILQNLLANAERHAPGQAVIRVAAGDEGWAEVRVDDRGPGVAPEEREAIFERGVHGGTDPASSGLGLYVARRLTRDLGGDLGVEDRPGGGASFWLRLPAEEAAGEGAPPGPPPRAAAS